MHEITSRTNQLIQHVAHLHKAQYRNLQQQYIAEGSRAIATIVDAGNEVINLFVTNDHVKQAHTLCPAERIYLVPDSVMEKISSTSTPSGLVAVFAIPKHTTTITAPAIALTQISDPGNMGTLIRTAVAMNIKTVICIEGAHPWSPKVVQASAGTIGSVKVLTLSWDDLLKHKKSIPLYALVSRNGAKPSSHTLNKGIIVIGNEAHGIPDEWLKNCEYAITLPMPGNAESLNAAVAGSIAMYLSATSAPI